MNKADQETINFASIEQIIQDIRSGKMVIMVDDENRENEGDLIIPASKVTPKSINFMAKYGRGLICLALDQSQVNKLNLSLMSPINNSRTQTAFTVSIDAKKGISTGISAHDRALTIKTAIKKNVSKKDIVSPGHVFPLISKNGGVLVRAGHTEASVDVSKLSKCGASVWPALTRTPPFFEIRGKTCPGDTISFLETFFLIAVLIVRALS
jgi:3,4-dihydroxy 2-butanone 4-phosphate synthase/GTP cyclohydrolase II